MRRTITGAATLGLAGMLSAVVLAGTVTERRRTTRSVARRRPTRSTARPATTSFRPGRERQADRRRGQRPARRWARRRQPRLRGRQGHRAGRRRRQGVGLLRDRQGPEAARRLDRRRFGGRGQLRSDALVRRDALEAVEAGGIGQLRDREWVGELTGRLREREREAHVRPGRDGARRSASRSSARRCTSRTRRSPSRCPGRCRRPIGDGSARGRSRTTTPRSAPVATPDRHGRASRSRSMSPRTRRAS